MTVRFAVAAAIGLAMATTTAFAQDDAPALEGVWTATHGVVIDAKGRSSQIPADFDVLEFEIHNQQGPVFQVKHRARHKAPGNNASHGGTSYEGQDHPAIGVVDGIGPLVVFADVGDTTTYQCNLIDENAMRCVLSESGDEAVAGFMLLNRSSK